MPLKIFREGDAPSLDPSPSHGPIVSEGLEGYIARHTFRMISLLLSNVGVLFPGAPSPSSAFNRCKGWQRKILTVELVVTIPFGIDMLQAFVVPGVHDLDHRSSQGNISNLHFYF
jgi:hypothetical protein